MDQISGDVLDVSIKIHRELGPGLLESVYETVLGAKLVAIGYRVERLVNDYDTSASLREQSIVMKILGLDPGLGTTGWGLIQADGNRLSHIANGQLRTDASESLPKRLSHLASQLEAILADHAPEAAAVEEVFVNKNPQSTLKLGQARGVTLMVAARSGLEVGEYAARLVKKAVVGVGNAEKAQVHAMVQRLLPGVQIAGPDAADALAVAITHAHHLATGRRVSRT